MANEQNLAKRFTSDQDREEASKNGKKGGVASGKARREKRIFKEEILKRLGEKDFETIVDNLISRAMKEDKSFEVLRDTMGQKPKEEIEASLTTEIKVELEDD